MDSISFLKQSIITDPGSLKHYYEVLPKEASQLLATVRGLIIHGDLGGLYGITFGRNQAKEELLRTVPQMLEKLLEIDPGPLSCIRPPKRRLVGMCRDYALLFVSFLRHKGYPARVRSGFAGYFQSEMPYEDHWLAEYYYAEEQRWVRVDVQLDEIQRKYYGIPFDVQDMPSDAGYILGGEAWLQCRSGVKHPEEFGYNKNWKGWHSVKGNLLHDFNSLLGMELLPWDLWTELSLKKYGDLSRQEKELLDEMAELTVRADCSGKELSSLCQRLPGQYMEAIQSKLRLSKIGKQEGVSDPDLLEPKLSLLSFDKNEQIPLSLKKNEPFLEIKGCRQNNLKNIHISIPREKLTVITGVSGSGKSSLAFDTIYAEGRRRYLGTMSNAAQMQEMIEKPDFDSIQGLTPTIAIEQKKGSLNPRSTVGTLTGISDQLRMLFVSIGTPYCPYCRVPVKKDSKNKNRCPSCGQLFEKLTVSSFNANTHAGACHECNGLGVLYQADPDRIVEDENLSVLDGATSYFGKLRGKKPTGNWMTGELFAIAADQGIDLEIPWKDLPGEFKHALFYGTGEKIYRYSYNSGGRNTEIRRPAAGVLAHINRLFREARTENNPQIQYMRKIPCPVCNGELLCIEARYTTILGYRFPELSKLPANRLLDFISTLENCLPEQKKERAAEVLREIRIRILYLIKVGLPYLTPGRTAPTLSGGELQRVRLSGQLLNELTGLTYILDEPSIGLHKRDHHLMIDTLKSLRDKGNTVIVVEHDRDTMLSADYLIDMGPGAGVYGGEVVAAGRVDQIEKNPLSVTGRFLREGGGKRITSPKTPREWLVIKNCTGNNLKHVTAHIPLHVMCCLTGVSGSGKSSLIFGSLIPALQKAFRCRGKAFPISQSLTGYENISGISMMDQSPIGKSSRSTPATYMGVWDSIRALYAKLPEAAEYEIEESHFSFNSKDGQCPHCQGLGQIKIAFQYMADHYVTCPECKGSRYQERILEVLYQGKSIGDVLNMDISQAIPFFSNIPEIEEKLAVLDEVGLSYLKLGQNTVSLSGGESQRLKLARELGTKQKKHMLYVLDEPSTGLHFQDIERLLKIFNRLTAKGHSLLIIEHNMEIIKSADWIIDMGPEGGEKGGQIIAEGTPEEIRKSTDSITGQYLDGGVL
ncbi:excinuclease ABC subunit UvrA [Lacrimispora sp. 38-1]|uniref:excinuclease ABC subunit UvrA n=1 Tax=Lacrimispora sp. 38-1 TaxID=3125778 RepID=UPI003CEB2DB2